MAMKVYNDPHTVHEVAFDLAENYIPNTFKGFYDASKEIYENPTMEGIQDAAMDFASAYIPLDQMNKFNESIRLAGKAYNGASYLKDKKDFV